EGKFPSKMCIPIKSKHRIVGVLDLEDMDRKRLGEDLRPLMEDLALNIGFVLENKRLYDDLKDYSEQLERKVEEKVQALRKSENRYRTIVENATDAIITTDLNGHLSWANRGFCELVDMEENEWEDMNISRIVKKGNLHRIFSSLRKVANGEEVKPFPLHILTQSGDERIVEIACTGIRENNRISGMEATLRDVTEKMVVDKLRKNYLQKLEEEVIHRTAEIKDTQRASILAIANLAESIDDDTGGHIQRIQYYSKALADQLRKDSPYRDQLTEEYAELIYDLSPLHDLGKVGIRDYILQKPDKLTSEEFEKMKDHTEIGAHALRMAGAMIHRESIFSIGEMIARFHHEKWDGSGYPAVQVGDEKRPLKGEEIPLCARIVATADVYDALTSKRPYKMPFPHEKAKEMIVNDSGKHFDPTIVKAFLECEEQFIEIRKQFPDTKMPEGKPFELPERDR
ncbi:MAG: PAS domain S-box protein, partial [Planctomycetota bacterium]|nr:PAS domain S-box protein [Planctomycetota bacterium]